MTELIQAIAQLAATVLISSIWQGAILAAMIWLSLKLVPRASASLRFAIWSAVFTVVALLPVLSRLIGHIGPSAESGLAPSVSAVVLDSRWAFGIAALWAAATLTRLFALARNGLRLASLYSRSIPVELTPALQSILALPGRRPRLAITSEVDQPCVIGFLAPRILIPGWLLDSATPAEIEQIVLHESAHLRRFDDWTNLLQKLIVACFPLNPAILWIEHRLCAEREIACDEAVVRATNAPHAYAACLTNLAEQRLSRRTIALSLGAWERRSELAGRVESILRGDANLGPVKARLLALALMAATVGGAIRLGGAAQLVSFASTQPTQTFAQSDPGITTRPHFQDVVFHPKASPAFDSPQSRPVSTSTAPAESSAAKPVHKARPRRAASPNGGIDSLVIVTRWQNSSGQQMTMVRQIVRISATSVVQSQYGWFVVQL